MKITSNYDRSNDFNPFATKPVSVEQDINDFHDKFGMHNGWEPTRQNIETRITMMQEELDEFREAYEAGDRVGMIDAIVDQVYFAVGTANLLGYKFDDHWTAVHGANMEKQRGTKSTRPNSAGFDMIKPEGWVAPEARHLDILNEQGPAKHNQIVELMNDAKTNS